ncbi:MAG: AraC family transcriptional regulator [Tannerellaceae bacterium]|nr:AraC family transcriptional regulator [Tannerellaceae bacterium]
MDLLYVKEHLNCKNYVSDFHIGFNYEERKAGEELDSEDEYFHYIVFLLKGELEVSTREYAKRRFSQGEMIFIPQNAEPRGVAITDVKFLVLSFDNQFSLCDQLTLDSLRVYPESEDPFVKLPIRSPMQMVIDSLIFYHEHKIRCKNLRAIKQKEVFLIFRTFYTKEEIAAFLSPILNRHLDFKSFILRHYQEVKTVDELADMCHISIRSFNRKFNESFGDSPYSWMLKQKSRYVRNRLADGKTPFAKIIKEFGFSSPVHFTTYCKKYFGCSPTQLRRKLIAEYMEEATGNRI